MATKFLKATFIGIILGLAWNVYHATRFLSRSTAFEEMSIGLSEEVVAQILLRDEIRCGISAHQENVCWFSDLWRDYYVSIDPRTRTVNRLSYTSRRSKPYF